MIKRHEEILAQKERARPERSMGTWQIKVRFLDGSITTLLYRRGMPPPAASGEVRLPDPRDAKKADQASDRRRCRIFAAARGRSRHLGVRGDGAVKLAREATFHTMPVTHNLWDFR
jgi:hypothetical protein